MRNPPWRLAGITAGMLGVLALGLGLALGAVFALVRHIDAPPADRLANIGGPFDLIDQTGAPRTDKDFAGTPMLIYFGYTFCPDICPTELAKMARAVDLLQAGGTAAQPIFVTPVFITIDPERDTPEHLAGYVRLFHPRLVGLTGDADAIADIAHAYKVFYAKVESDEFSDYLMDHSSYFYLVDGQGETVGVFPMALTAQELAEAVRAHLPKDGGIG